MEKSICQILKQHSTSIAPILKLIPIMLTQFIKHLLHELTLYWAVIFLVPHRSYPISNESAKEMKESELVSLGLMPMKEFALPFQYFLKTNASHKLKNHWYRTLISQQVIVLHLSAHTRSDKTMSETLIMIQKMRQEEGGGIAVVWEHM